MTLTLEEKTGIVQKYCDSMSDCSVCPFKYDGCNFRDPDAIEKMYQEISQTKTIKDNDTVNSPTYYNDGKIEVIEYIEDKKLGFCLGNAIKYISRAGKKDPTKEVEDLRKAIWYIERHIKTLEEVKND